MIKRFKKIKGVGRFYDCEIGGKEFEKNTIIFGRNTDGKSTLTDILWSLKTGDAAIIEGRKTFGFDGTQQIEIFDEDNRLFGFPSSEWNNGFEDIEIFDSQFINKNIFQGNEITYGQQQNLHSIIIGPKGQEFKDKIDSLQAEIEALTNQKKAKTNEFNRTFNREIEFRKFESLAKIKNIDEEIKKLQDTIKIAGNQERIKNVFDKIESLLDGIRNSDTKKILSNSIKIKAELVTNHILKTWRDPSHTKDFLQEGLNLTKEEKKECVFCGQELDDNAVELLTAYSKLFSTEYKKLQSDIHDAVLKFEKWDPISYLSSVQDKLASFNIDFDITKFNKSEISNLKEKINLEFKKKRSDVGYEVNFCNYDNIIEIFEKVKVQVDGLKKENIFENKGEIEKLNKRIKELELTKLRHTKDWDDFIQEYHGIDSIQEKKKQEREELRKQFDKYSEDIFSKHLDTINEVLDHLNADFKICDFRPIKKIVGQNERIFALKFFSDYRVAIDGIATDKPNFKNTLSDSDKRVLAFAFFYSLMIHDERLEEKTVVFDDPFSSFDEGRRLRTVQLLANPYLVTAEGETIKKDIKQLIILTHECSFFKWLYRRLDIPKSLKIVQDGDINGVKKSTIDDCNVKEEFIEDENLKSLKEIKSIHSSNLPITDYDGLCIKCRKVLEGIFTEKYLFELEEEINTNKSIRSFVDKLKELALNGFDDDTKYKKFLFLCDSLNIELHNNTLKNEGQEAQSVLGDFLRLIKLI